MKFIKIYLIFLSLTLITLKHFSQLPKRLINEINQMIESDQKYRLMIMYGETNKNKLDSIINLPFEKRIAILSNRNTDKYYLSKKTVDSLWQLQFHNDSINFIKLKVIIVDYGWPGVDEEIKDKCVAILLHTKEMQLLNINQILLKEVEEKRMSPNDYATLWDRKLIEKGELQLYGTINSWDTETNIEVPPIIKDINETNAARGKLGLSKLKEYKVSNKSGN